MRYIEINQPKMNHVPDGVHYKPKIPIICDFVNGKYRYYDGTRFFSISEESRKAILSYKTKYILIKKGKNDKKRDPTTGKITIEKTMEEIYHEFVTDADEMKKATNGLVNMYKSGRDAVTSMNLAYYFLNEKSRHARAIVPEPITEEEARWIEDASIGALICAEEYQGPGWKYDINSSYPSIMSDHRFMIPIKEGEFKTIKPEIHYPTGIYRFDISYPNDELKWKKLFRINQKNKYTSIDIKYAQKIGLNVRLIEDGKVNALVYTRDKCKTGYQCFKDFVDMLYKLRENPIIKARCKALLRCLWGSLCQRDEIIMKFDITKGEEFLFDENKKEVFFEPITDDIYKITIRRLGKIFATDWARMKPFILAKGRSNIGNYIESCVDNIKYLHTDGFVSSVPLAYITSLKLGHLKFEGACPDYYVENIQSTEGIFG